MAEQHADQAARRGRGTRLAGVSPHTLRRRVGTLVARSAGLDAAPEVLGHRDPSVTARHYVAEMGRVAGLLATSVGLVLVGAARKCYLHDAVILLLITESDLSAHEREPAIGCALSGGVG